MFALVFSRASSPVYDKSCESHDHRPTASFFGCTVSLGQKQYCMGCSDVFMKSTDVSPDGSMKKIMPHLSNEQMNLLEMITILFFQFIKCLT